jgi:Patatin-like phospholipase
VARRQGSLRGHRLKNHNVEAFLWASVTATALWTGIPTLGLHLLLGVGIGVACFIGFVRANRRTTQPRHDLYVQLATLFLLAGAIWLAGSPRAGNGATVYRHLLLPVIVGLGVSLLFADIFAVRLCAPLQSISGYSKYLGATELFQSRGTRLPPRGVVSWIAFIISSLALHALRVVWPAAIAVLVAPPAYVTVAGVSALIVSLIILLLTIIDERLEFILNTMTDRFFRHAAGGVTLVILALAAARAMRNTYVTTIFDAAPKTEILLYLLFAYAMSWWFDYWMDRLIGQQLLVLLDPKAGDACSIDYSYRGAAVTSVPSDQRTLELCGLGRFLVYRENADHPHEPYFQTWPYRDFFVQLAATGAPGGKSTPLPRQIESQLTRFFGSVLVCAAGLLGAGAWWVSHEVQEHELAVNSRQPSRLLLSTLLGSPERCDGRPALLVAASGGGTRAGVFTAAILEGLSRSHPRDIIVGSGVSGGAAALAYYASKRPELSASTAGAWDRFFKTISMPFIQDVIERAAEWRMVSGGRLGMLLAESFERRWDLATNRNQFGAIDDFGLICNTTLAGRFDRALLSADENRGLTLPEAASRYFDRTRSDVAGGRLVLTNLALRRAFSSSHALPFSQRVTLPILVDDTGVRLERAAALSANFPPVFSNAAVDVGDGQRYWVTDGGAADNRGLEPVLYALRDALSDPQRPRCAKLPSIQIVVIEASGIDDRFQQDRGIGSALGAGAQFADQLNSELANGLLNYYRAANQEGDLQFYFVPMPEMLRRSGSFGTHWMLQGSIEVRHDATKKTFDGEKVMATLRAAYGCETDAEPELLEWILETPEFKERWCGLLRLMPAGAAARTCHCNN